MNRHGSARPVATPSASADAPTLGYSASVAACWPAKSVTYGRGKVPADATPGCAAPCRGLRERFRVGLADPAGGGYLGRTRIGLEVGLVPGDHRSDNIL